MIGMVGPTSRHQQPAVGEQRRRVEQPTSIEVACESPISRGRIVKLRAYECGVWKSLRTWSRTACDQHPAIGEQRRRVIIPSNIEAAGKLPLKGSSGTRLHQHRRTYEQQRQRQASAEYCRQRAKSILQTASPERTCERLNPACYWSESFHGGPSFCLLFLVFPGCISVAA